MKPVSLKKIYDLRNAQQFFHDCYLVSSVNALTRCENGRKLLQQNIAGCNGSFKIKFNDINGTAADFFISKSDLKNLIFRDQYGDIVTIDGALPIHNRIIKAIECAMNAIIKKHPDKKPFISRFKDCNELFEFNKPSNFMSMFTGEKPIKLNEDGIRLSLRTKKEKAFELFERMDKENDFSFVAGTSFDENVGLTEFHCYTIEGVNFNNKYLQLYNNKAQESRSIDFETAIKGLKFITGYFNNML